MALLSSLVPALREIRGPLVAGYLWLVCAWLLFEPVLPSRDSHSLYQRLATLGEAIGPVGLAVVASVAAYLVGSLFQSLVRFAWVRLVKRFPALQIRKVLPARLANDYEDIFKEIESGDDLDEIQRITEIADPFRHMFMQSYLTRALPSDEEQEKHAFKEKQSLRDRTRSRSIWEIVDRELSESFRQLQRSVEAVQDRHRDRAIADIDMLGGVPTVRLRLPEHPDIDAEFVIPHFLPVRDLLSQIPLLQTRLLEIAETTGTQVERLNAEADFRFTIVPPLITLTAILSIGVSPLWLFTLILLGALVAQGIDLAQQGTEQLIDALRARIQTSELQQITPIFERYRTQTTQLVDGLRIAEWPERRASTDVR